MDPGTSNRDREILDAIENIFKRDFDQVGALGVNASNRSSVKPAMPWVTKSIDNYLSGAPDYYTKSMQYTKPDLRERLKREITAGDKGGRAGQWSARKAQLLALEYRKRGGGYRGKLGKTQRSIRRWTREKWTTSDGKPANRSGGMRRYLPANAWSRLTPAERAATNRKKIIGDSKGRQFVANTEKARTVGGNVRRSRTSN